MVVIGHNIIGTYIAYIANIMPTLVALPCKCKGHAKYSGTVLAGGRNVGSLGGGGNFVSVKC